MNKLLLTFLVPLFSLGQSDLNSMYIGDLLPDAPTKEVMVPGLHIDEYLRYADSVWDQRRINNINQHFITAFLGMKLKNIKDYSPYLDAKKFEEQDPWHGFLPRTSVGLEFRMATPAQ